MTARVSSISGRSQKPRTAWRALEMHHKKVREYHLRDLFANEPNRSDRMSAEGAGLFLDYSKNRITHHTLKLLIELAEESGLHARIDALFRGENVNTTEGRPALHVALRAPRGTSIFVDGKNVVPQVHSALDKMKHLCNQIRSGDWTGHTGKRIRHIVNIGRGGFHLGPAMAFEALKFYSNPALSFHFIGNIDGTEFVEAVRDLDPAETLFLVCSKSFLDRETMTNAQTARAWQLAAAAGDEKALSKHFVAISASITNVTKFGIDAANVLEFWDWVGERYSIGSTVGLSTMLSIGPEKFLTMLDGFHQMDMHYLASPFERNLPVLMGLLSVWYNNLFGAETAAVFPYDRYLALLPAYLQELIMESNGKSVTLIGTHVTRQTSPIYWGEPGTKSQHSFSQLLHQGSRLIPCDFIGFAQSLNGPDEHHDILMANLLAQGEALAFGRKAEDLREEGTPDWLVPHRVLEGNRPSNTILAQRLTPETLGKLIALYEHSVHTQGIIWNINSFDQWGIELGTQLADKFIAELESKPETEADQNSSTNALIRRYRQLKNVA